MCGTFLDNLVKERKGNKMQEWVLVRKGGDFNGIEEKFHINNRIAALIRNREIITDEEIRRYLEGSLSDLYDGMLMKDMDKACEILKEKIEAQESIRIIGDYDIDGINASYILLEGLSKFVQNISYDIPHRIRDGYGINEDLIKKAYEDGVDTIITCDNGISATEAIAYGKSLGMTIIVTDHHEVPKLLPPADALVNPKRLDCSYPYKGLCGAAVAYKLVEVLYDIQGEDVSDMDYLLEHVAIATIGDVMELKDENRILVKEGLSRLRRTKNIGLSALIQAAGIKKESIGAYHIGFVLGPMLNAGGRLDTAKKGLELLMSQDERKAGRLADELKNLNTSRKDMTEEACRNAFLLIEEKRLYEENIITVYLENCHESLAGIVAGRIREKYYRPAFVLTDSKEMLKGSGRSIPAYNMYQGLTEVKGLLTRFGGHSQAAGISLVKENLPTLARELNKKSRLISSDFIQKIRIDMELPFAAISWEFILQLSLLEPFGVGNEKPIFAAREVFLSNTAIIGKSKNVLKAKATDKNGVIIDAISFREIEKMEKETRGKSLNILFYPQINEYMGTKTLQIVITDYRILSFRKM